MRKNLPNRTVYRLFLLTNLTLGASCKPSHDDGHRVLSAKRKVSWEQLQVGQKFRMNPPDQTSKCYLPGDRALSLGNCGDQEYWIVTSAHNLYIKQIKSTIDNKCLSFSGQNLVSSECTSDAIPPPTNSWGDQNHSPIQKQYLSVQGSSLVPAFRRDCSSVKGSRVRSGGKCVVIADSSKPEGRSPPVEFSVDSDKESADSKLIYRSNVKKGKNEPFSGSFASELRWGHVPRITAIYVATNEAHESAARNSYITGIQIIHSDGSKQLFGSCQKDNRDLCKVNSDDHPGYPNPRFFEKDEHITDVGMNFGEGEYRDGSTKLVEIIIKTNKQNQKTMLWKGRGDGKVKRQWLSVEKNTVIAGFFGTFHNPGHFPHHLIRSMGVIYAHVNAYKAHHPEDFQTKAPGKIMSLAQKDGTNLIGATQATSSFNSRAILTSVPVKGSEESVDKARRAYEKIFQDPSYQFSSTFYASAMGASVRTSSIRMYFKNSMLAAIVVHPDGVNGLIQPEIYGSIPDGQTPDLYLELGANEYISRINWQVFNNPPWGQQGHKPLSIQGPLIYGVQLVTNKGRSAVHSSFHNAQPWQYGMGKDGYAIVGFHGSSSHGDAASNLRIEGIITLGAWLVKLSELPDSTQKQSEESRVSDTGFCPAKTFRNQSDHSYVDFNLPSSRSANTNTITINGGAYNRYHHAKCNRVWWSDLTFVCRGTVWTRDSGDWNADGLCHGSYEGESQYVTVGNF